MKFGKIRIENGELKFTKMMKSCKIFCEDIVWAYRRKEDANGKMCCGVATFTSNFVMIFTKHKERYQFEMTEEEAKACLRYLKECNENLIMGFPKGAPLPLNSSFNTRDLGGIKGEGGKCILPHKLIRSGDLYHLSFEDQQLLRDEYHLQCVIDFRTETEKEEKPNTEIEGVLYVDNPILESQMPGITREKNSMEQFSMLGDNPEKYMIDLYQKLVLDKTAQNRYAKFFQYILDYGDKGAVLWNCTAGKDRTGIASMLLLFALGVSRGAIIDDYMRTNNALKLETDYIIRLLETKETVQTGIENVKAMLVAKESYIQSAINTISAEYGTMERYLRKAMCLTPKYVNILRERYLTN